MLASHTTGNKGPGLRAAALLAAIVSFALTPRNAAVAQGLSFDGSLGSALEALADVPPPPIIPPEVSQTVPAPKASAESCKLSKQAKKSLREPAEAVVPEVISDIEPFTLTPDEIAQTEKAVPAPQTSLAEKLAAIMKRAYVGGSIEEPFSGDRLRVVTWNLNAAHTRDAVDALIAALTNSPPGVQEALGRKKPVSQKAAADFDDLSRGDIYLLQEVPLPTAVELARAMGMQVFWAPEFIEVGDNAKGRNPLKGENFTGNAILSRAPLGDFHILRYNNQADWYYDQKASQALGDKLTKVAGQVIFAADPGRPHQTRPPLPYGGRVALFARASFSGHSIWLGDLHLEDRPGTRMTGPELRCAQAVEAVNFISGLGGAAIFGGDLNTFGENVGIGEGGDLATEGPNAKHPNQPPIYRQRGFGAGVGNKFFGAVDAANLATTLTHNPGSRKGLVLRQSAAVAIDVVPYAPTVHDGLNAIRKVKRNPTPATITRAAIETGSDFFPYTAVGYRGYRVFADERSRHDPSSRFNPDNHLFRTVENTLDVKPLNPRTGFRFGVGGYKSTWASGRDLHLFNTVLDWLFLIDPDGTLSPSESKVLKDAVTGSRRGSRGAGRLSDHYPLAVDITFKDGVT